MNNTTHNNNNTTISELNLKSKKTMQKRKKVEDAVEEVSPPTKQGPSYGYTKKGAYGSSTDKDPSSDEKFNRTGSAESGVKGKNTKGKTKGQVSDDKNSSSQDSERGRRIIQ